MFKNDNDALFLKNTGAKLLQFIPATIPDVAKIIIWLVLVLIAPALCCIIVRFVFSLFGAKYKNADIGKDGLEGAEAIKEAIDSFKTARKHYDITWNLPESWKYNLIFSIAFLLPVFIQFYLLSESTAEGIVSLILISVLIGGIGGLILLLPIAGLKGISNFLCNRTCIFLKNSKEKEYNDAIKIMSNYIKELKHKIEKEEEAEYKRKEKERISKEKDELLNKIKKGQELYNEAMSKVPPDDNLLKEAAKLGDISACYYLGKNLLSDWLSDMYTAEEKEEIAEDAAKYFDVARQMAALANLDIKTECEFLWMFSRLQYERNTKTNWKQMLQDFRSIQKSGKLSEEYSDTLNSAIKTVINTIDTLDRQENSQTTPTYEPTKTLHCKFRNGAICTKDSGSTMIYHCNYVDCPAACPTARSNNGLEYR